tara:strand:+ start:184 stop:486 length:303 start_codon:yes stop_codon:yes gene_type:complete
MRQLPKQYATLIYTGSGSNNTATVAGKTNMRIALWGCINTGGDQEITDSDGARILLVPADGVIILDSPIMTAKGKGIEMGGSNMQVFYTFIDDTVASGAY